MFKTAVRKKRMRRLVERSRPAEFRPEAEKILQLPFYRTHKNVSEM